MSRLLALKRLPGADAKPMTERSDYSGESGKAEQEV